MKYFCYLMILPFLLAPIGTAMADGPTGNTQADIQKLFKIIEAQQKKIEALEKKVEQYEEMMPETAREVAKEEIKPLMTARPMAKAGLHEDEKEGWFTMASISMMRPGGLDNIDYAVRQHPTDPDEGSIGDMHSIEFGWQPAWRAGVGYRKDNGNELAFSYWGSVFDEDDSVSDPDNIASVLLHCETDDAEDVDAASAEMDVSVHRFGVDFFHPFYENEQIRFAWGAGLHYMYMNEELNVEYFDDGTLEAFLDAEVTNHYIGPRIATKAEYSFRSPFLNELSLRGELGVALFASWTDLDQVEGPIADVDAPVDIEDDRSQVNPVLDGTLGVVWRMDKSWKFSLDYEFMWIHNAYTLHQGLDDTSEGQSRQWDEDLTFHGLTLEVKYTF
jgi:hypothetical protein